MLIETTKSVKIKTLRVGEPGVPGENAGHKSLVQRLEIRIDEDSPLVFVRDLLTGGDREISKTARDAFKSKSWVRIRFVSARGNERHITMIVLRDRE